MDESFIRENLPNEFWETNNFIKWNYEMEFSCKESGCLEDDYCRCGKIENLQCDEINIFEFSKLIYDKLNRSSKNTKRKIGILNILNNFDYKTINLYFINRLLSINKIWSCNMWTCDIKNGYYGQELGKISIIVHVYDSLISQLVELFSLENLEEKVEHSLKLEYGWLREDLKNKTYEVLKIKKTDLKFPESGHKLKVETKNLDFLKNTDLDIPKGIAIKCGENYKLVDGHHRVTADNKDYITLIIAK